MHCCIKSLFKVNYVLYCLNVSAIVGIQSFLDLLDAFSCLENMFSHSFIFLEQDNRSDC